MARTRIPPAGSRAAALTAAVPTVALNGPPLDLDGADGVPIRLVNNLNVRVAGVDGQSLLASLSADGVALSSGSACSAEHPRPSHVLTALGLDADDVRACLRFGLSVAPEAKTISRATAPMAAANVSRAASTAARDSRPSSWVTLPALP